MGKGDNFRKAAPVVEDVRILTVDGAELPPAEVNDLHNYRGDLKHDLPRDLENFILTRFNLDSRMVRIVTGRGGKRSIFAATGEALQAMKLKVNSCIETFSPEHSSATGSYIVLLKD